MPNWVQALKANMPELAAKVVFKRARHSVHFLNDDGSVTGMFSGAPCHYQDAKGEWHEIDTDLKLDAARNEYGAAGLDVRINAEGLVRVIKHLELGVTRYSQVTTRVGAYNTNTNAFTGAVTLGAGEISGNTYTRKSGRYVHQLTLTETGIRETLTLNSRVPTNNANVWLVMETLVTGLDLPDGWINEDVAVLENRLHLPTVVDANGKEGNARYYARKVDGQQYIFTGVRSDWMYSAAYPVVIDPDYMSDVNDFDIYGNNAVYAISRSTANSMEIGYIARALGQLFNVLYLTQRMFFRFDTSSIPNDAVVTQANLTLTSTLRAVTLNFDVQIVKCDWSPYDPATLNPTTREIVYDMCLDSALDDSIWRSTVGMAINTPYTSGPLSTSWINKTGFTYYGLRSSLDAEAVAPTGNEFIYICFAENTNPAYRPKLTVTYIPSETGTVEATLQPLEVAAAGIQGPIIGDVTLQPLAVSVQGASANVLIELTASQAKVYQLTAAQAG